MTTKTLLITLLTLALCSACSSEKKQTRDDETSQPTPDVTEEDTAEEPSPEASTAEDAGDAGGDVEDGPGDPPVRGVAALPAEQASAILDEARPTIASLHTSPRPDTGEWPEAEELLDASAYTPHVYPMKEGVSLIYFAQVPADGEERQQTRDAVLLYDHERKSAPLQRGQINYRGRQSFQFVKTGDAHNLLYITDGHAGGCVMGGVIEVWSATAGEPAKLFERGWSTTEDGGAATVSADAAGTLTFELHPVTEKNPDEDTFVSNVVKQTCTWKGSAYECADEVIKRDVTGPGCFAY